MRNELVGHYRKTGDRERALENGEAALKLLGQLDLVGSITAGTTYVNLATALNAFGENERALALFERARPIYESSTATRPELLGGLYNNMGLTCAALGRYDEAEALYDKAVARMQTLPRGAREAAVTCLNRADLVEARDGMEAGEGAIYALVAVSMNLLNGFTGLFSLGQAGFMLVGAYTYGVLTIPVAERGRPDPVRAAPRARDRSGRRLRRHLRVPDRPAAWRAARSPGLLRG